MEKLDFNQMELVEGGDLLDGACAVTGIIGAGTGLYAGLAAVGVRIAVAAPTGWGALALGVMGVACAGRYIFELY